MANTPVATNIHKALDIHLDLRTKVTLNLIACAYHLTNFSRLIVRPVLHLDITINTSLIQNRLRGTTTNTINVGQRDLSSFILWQVNTNYSYSHISYL